MLVRTDLSRLYLELLKSSLVNELYIDNEARLIGVLISLLNALPLRFDDLTTYGRDQGLIGKLREFKERGSLIQLIRKRPDGSTEYANEMRNYTELSHTMIGRMRLDNLQYCIETALDDGVGGDLAETGIWRGGACVLMRGVLAAYGVTDRIVWGADSFEGVPASTHPQDAGLDLSAATFPVLAVSVEEVEELFRRYGLLDERVRFLKGLFKDTLADAPIESLAVLRLDGDLYESTMDALVPLYDRVSPGGFVIVDDYYSCAPCGRAVDEFRSSRAIASPLEQIDAQSVYWRKA